MCWPRRTRLTASQGAAPEDPQGDAADRRGLVLLPEEAEEGADDVPSVRLFGNDVQAEPVGGGGGPKLQAVEGWKTR
jgi:hypothetical protein